MQNVLSRLEKSLFGNGQPGVIAQHTQRLDKLERGYWIALAVVGTIQFLTGNGFLSLQGLMGRH